MRARHQVNALVAHERDGAGDFGKAYRLLRQAMPVLRANFAVGEVELAREAVKLVSVGVQSGAAPATLAVDLQWATEVVRACREASLQRELDELQAIVQRE